MREYHPFNSFVPDNARYLILGSFAAKKSSEYTWFYSTKRNQFWSILEKVYKTELKSKEQKIELFSKYHIAITDIIKSCERSKNNSSDTNLINIEYNKGEIGMILRDNKIERIYFTSKFVEKRYKKEFREYVEKYPKVELVILPSPSPRYAKLTFIEKVKIYRDALPE